MRALLEFLGLARPDRTRREPIALPAWLRVLVPIAASVVVGLLALGSTFLVRALLH